MPQLMSYDFPEYYEIAFSFRDGDRADEDHRGASRYVQRLDCAMFFRQVNVFRMLHTGS
jgi:hypothetical protein